MLVNIEGIEVNIEVSDHAKDRAIERNVSEYAVMSLILKVGEELLQLKDGEEIGIIDKETNIGAIASINVLDTNVYIDVITVISNDNIWISRGIKILHVNDIL